MPKKIRVYELARELGLENKDILDLSDELKIGLKSHSSSIEDAQADRVRRLAREKGIAKTPEEMEAERRAEAEAKRQAEEGERRVVRAGGAPKPAPAPTEAEAVLVAPSEPAHRVIRSTVTAAEVEEAAPTRAVRPPEAPAAPPAPTPAEEVAPAAAEELLERPAAAAAEAVEGLEQAPRVPKPQRRVEKPPMSATGRPIPPPPGMGGRKIPPPPGRGAGGPGGPGGAGRVGGAGRPGGPSGPRTGFGGPCGGSRVGGGPPRPGVGAGAAAPPPGGRGRPGGPPQRRRKKRRRRSEEELEPQQMTTFTPANAPVPEGEIVIERGITPQEYGPKLNRTAADIVRMLLDAGEMVTATQSLSDEMIELIADEFGAEIVLVDPGQEEEVELQQLLSEAEDEGEDEEALLEPRPPIVTVMGHVDHGKTLLLDRIRSTNVVAQEAGGITQHIGAYQAARDGRRITFVDTPGHEAFTAMRARGARATDIAVLVVAADDGVMPQTVEAINHAKAADVPIVVALNKIDKATSDELQHVRQQLAEQGLVPEEWGGDTVINEISALQSQGIDELLDSILLVAEIEELRANPKAPARGVVLEANLDPGRGPVASIIVKRGTLRVGDPVVAGAAWGRVRALIDDRGERVEEAGPATPVEVLGFDEVPTAGDELRVAPDEKVARVVAEARGRRRRKTQLLGTAAVGAGTKLEDIFAQIQKGEVATLNLILKADVQGSLEALTEALRRLERDEVKLAFVHRAVGGITENDVQLASASDATIIGFNVRPDRMAREMADQQRVEVRLYEVIYKAIEEIEAAMLGLLAPEFEEVVTGEAEVREVFAVPRVGRVAGCYVTNGQIKRGDKVRFLREGVVIWKGEISSLKRFKEDVREVATGYECGIGLENYQDLKQGDVIETYDLREIPRA